MLSEILHLSQTRSGHLPISWLVGVIKSQIPLSSFSGGDPEGLSPFQFLVFRPNL